ncbi:hypothetical protein GGS23DRAFT_230894 [Durotheca rogersii]|uniref:uncharacterized protein n=1 Tax=Durotheca rogersii TaxID=419775 RepID=UPI002220FF28|nr:uncharacterized protein GGS23DRAFT_230894 [Durotheca rogersii]KAI5860599.1 hypothetical protein GGS23DRAFT_230894 [Durotheca rogersii]
MSQPKITSKNLAYTSELPPFLARLRGQHQQQRDSDRPDPLLAAHRRAARPRSASEEAEDAPLVVDEAGNTVHFDFEDETDTADVPSQAVDGREGGTGAGAGAGAGADKGRGGENQNEARNQEKVAGIGAGKKRKVGRVVGGDDGEEGEEERGQHTKARIAKGDRQLATPTAKNSDRKGEADTSTKDAKQAKKKKAKKIKLSFGDDDAE